ncbi:hypothetical protein Rsub_02332 [Raphidocelis subcapitata]|uniref:Dynein heavy chain linker domain-containing protein n=1 Tax=Raphidocelis subcapitata TaxID=307507 RepID=A0A2V0NPS6_9CHLO|nr:hypothetical protein Rsub_02332 [Raphidocelis subcapitata]|eukprot:GBF89614.1 hypothetical protein Rsub_02332 [Raphidocelis subcapitata]
MLSAPASRSRAGSPDPQAAAALQASAAAAVAARISLPRARSPATPAPPPRRPSPLESQAQQHQQQQQRQQRGGSPLQAITQQQLPATVRDALLCLAQEGGTPAGGCAAATGADDERRQGTGQQQQQHVFYLLPAPDWHPAINPYALELSDRAAAVSAPHFFTLTAAGIVEARAGCTPEHTPLGEWLRGASLHTTLRGLAAFKQLWAGDTLQRWRAAARRARFERVRASVARRLLLLRPGFRGAVSEARARLAEVAAAGALGPLPDEGTYLLEAVAAAQSEHHRGRLALLLARNVGAICASAAALAARAKRSEAGLREQLASYDRDPSAGASAGVSPVKAKQVQAERDAVASLHAAAREESAMLPAFLRLLDFTVLQSELDLLTAAVAGVRAHLGRPGVAAEAAVGWGAEGPVFEPPQDEFLKVMGRGIVESLVAVVKEVPLPSRHPALAPLLAPPPPPARPPPRAAAAAAASGSAGHQEGGFAFVSLEAAFAAAAAMQQASSGGGGGIDDAASRPKHASAATGRPAASASSVSAIAAAAAAAAAAPMAGHQITLMAVGDAALGTQRRGCDLIVMRSYKEAARSAEALRDLAPALAFGAAWDADDYKSRPHTVGGLRHDAAVLSEWIESLRQLPSSRAAGCLALQVEPFKQRHLQTLKAALTTVCALLLCAARREAGRALAELQRAPPNAALPEAAAGAPSEAAGARKAALQSADALVGLLEGVVAWGHLLSHNDQVLLDDLREAIRRQQRPAPARQRASGAGGSGGWGGAARP